MSLQSPDDRLRERLYETMNDPELSLSTKTERALEIGREYLDVESGHVQRYDEASGTHDVIASVGREEEIVPVGATLDHATVYCERTIEADSPVAISDATRQGWEDHPAYREHGMDCYLGTTVFVEGEVYGTVCFVSPETRESEFGAGEKSVVELIARLLGRQLEATRHEAELDAREAALEESELKYESLLRTAPEAILLIDTHTGEIAKANNAVTELVGYERSTITEMDITELYPPEDRSRYAGNLERFTEHDGARERFADGTRVYVRHRDGTDIPVEVSADLAEIGDREYFQCIVRDISDRLEREEELRVKNRAVEEASVGIVIADADDDDLPMVYANREFERITGYSNDVTLGLNCRFLQGRGTDPEDIAEIREALSAEEPLTTELLNYRADGTPFWNELTIAPVSGPHADRTTHFVGFQRDVTARKRRDRMLEVLNRVLRHNLRNDMTVIGGNAEVLAERTEGSTAELAESIAETAGELTELSAKARSLEAAVSDSTQLESRDVAADVRAATEQLRSTHPEATFTVEAPEDCRAVATERLRLAVRELAENAVEHGDASTVSLRVEGGDESVSVVVHNEGPPLPTHEQRVLETGRETPLEHGEGLGLWLVNWIVTGLGGTVTANTDDGTTVRLSLPAADEEDPGGALDYRRQAAISHRSD
jgi:PAS domain S-box-containing protein